MKNVAIIGAGIAGLRAGQRLAPRCEVTLFEKSRGVSGRMSTRYHGDYEFDHGAQYFTVKSDAFTDFLSSYVIAGDVVPWIPEGLPELNNLKYIASPRMNSLCKAMAAALDVRLGARVGKANFKDGRWILTGTEGEDFGRFDGLIMATPAAQAREMLGGDGSQEIQNIAHSANFTLMVGLSERWTGAWEAIRPDNDVIGWATVNSSKPGRNNNNTALVIQSRNNWAENNKDADQNWVCLQMIQAFTSITGINVSDAKVLALHRWLHANVDTAFGQNIFADETRKLIVAGDGCLGGRVESAWLSGDAAGARASEWLKRA